MDDITSKINEILNNPESMQTIMNLASSLGLNTQQEAPPPPPAPDTNDTSALISRLASLLNNQTPVSNQPVPVSSTPVGGDTSSLLSSLASMLGQAQTPQPAASSAPNIDVNMLANIQRAMSAFSQSDKNVDLLRALKPHFSVERQKKVDDAIRIMQLIKLLPMLKESGLFGGDTT